MAGSDRQVGARHVSGEVWCGLSGLGRQGKARSDWVRHGLVR